MVMETVVTGKPVVENNLEESKLEDIFLEESSPNQNEDDWSNVPTISQDKTNLCDFLSEFITVEEAVNYFKSSNLPKDPFKEIVEKSKFSEFLRWLKSPPQLDNSLQPEVDLIFSLTHSVLDWNDSIQGRMLQTIYKKLTGAKLDCPQYGTHWQLIGFQGNDPATDFRAVGLFGLVQLLSLTSKGILPLGRHLYRVANSDDQPFPLAVLSINVTNIVLNVFNSDKLNRECNTQKSVINTLNSFYAAILVYMLNAWVTQKKTIIDSGYLLKDAEKYCGRNVKRVLKDLPQQLKKYELMNIN